MDESVQLSWPQALDRRDGYVFGQRTARHFKLGTIDSDAVIELMMRAFEEFPSQEEHARVGYRHAIDTFDVSMSEEDWAELVDQYVKPRRVRFDSEVQKGSLS